MTAGERVELTLDPHPGSTDGHVGGVIELRGVALRATEYVVELTCTELRRRAKNESSSSVVWQDIGRFACRRRLGDVLEVRFCFFVPEEAPHSSEPPGGHHTWRVEIRSARLDEDFIRHWTVPVLASGVQASAESAALVLAAPAAASVDEALHLTRDAAGFRMVPPAGRYAVGGAWMLAFGVAACGFAWVMGQTSRPDSVMQFLLWLCGVPTIAGGVWLLGNALQVELRGGSVGIRRHLFGMPVAKRELAASRIRGLRVDKSGWSEQGAETRVYYVVQLEDVDGGKHTVVEALVGYGAALRAARRLSELTGSKLLSGPPAQTVVTPPVSAPAAVQASPQVAAPLRAPPRPREVPLPRAPAPRMPAASGFIDRLVDSRNEIMRHGYVGTAIAAVFCLGLGYALGLARLPALLKGAKTNGTIVDSKPTTFEGSSGESSHVVHMPIVEFEANGRILRFKDMWGDRSTPTGTEQVTVIYDPADPDNALIDGGVRNWMPWAPLSAFGAFLAVAAFRSGLASRRRR